MLYKITRVDFNEYNIYIERELYFSVVKEICSVHTGIFQKMDRCKDLIVLLGLKRNGDWLLSYIKTSVFLEKDMSSCIECDYIACAMTGDFHSL